MKSNEEMILADSDIDVRNEFERNCDLKVLITLRSITCTLAAWESHEFISRPNWLKSFFQGHNFLIAYITARIISLFDILNLAETVNQFHLSFTREEIDIFARGNSAKLCSYNSGILRTGSASI